MAWHSRSIPYTLFVLKFKFQNVQAALQQLVRTYIPAPDFEQSTYMHVAEAAMLADKAETMQKLLTEAADRAASAEQANTSDAAGMSGVGRDQAVRAQQAGDAAATVATGGQPAAVATGADASKGRAQVAALREAACLAARAAAAQEAALQLSAADSQAPVASQAHEAHEEQAMETA